MLTFKNIQDEVLLLWDQPGETGNFLTIVKNAINDAHKRRCTSQRWSFMLWEDVLTFATVSGTLTYRAHPLLDTFHRIYNKTDEKPLKEVAPRDYYQVPLNKYYFHKVENSPVSADPASTGTLSIESSSASDTEAAKAVIIRFIDGSNDIQEETLTPTGTTPAPTTASAAKVLSVTKGGTWLGTMTLKDSGSNTILTLGITEYGKQYPQIRLLVDPKSADTVEYRFYRKSRKLSNDNDIPDIPDPYSSILIWDAALIIAAYDEAREPPEWQRKKAEWEKLMADQYLEGQALGAEPRQVRNVTHR